MPFYVMVIIGVDRIDSFPVLEKFEFLILQYMKLQAFNRSQDKFT